jgi:predicted dehydrogenase
MSDQDSQARRTISRRSFIKRTTVASAAAIGFPAIVPASALGQGGAVAPSERIVMGCIGVGSQGTGNMKGFLGLPDFQFVAVCDVDRGHRENARNIVNETYGNQDCADYNDYRELLERDDLDGVSIALPDHWHSIPSIAAANKGLDIYAEKPLALTIREGRAMVNAVEKNGTVWQTGSWQRSQANFLKVCELVRNGVIGNITKVEVGLPTGSTIEHQPEMPVPNGFDYDFWLGPAPYAPYTQRRCHWDFRWILDYSGGQLTDWAAHHCDIANWGMGTEHTGPTYIEGEGVFPKTGLWNAATDYHVWAWYGPGQSPVASQGFWMHVSNKNEMGARFYGENGSIHVTRGGSSSNPASLLETELDDNAIRLYHSRHHGRNFIECVRTRERCVAPIQAAHTAINIAHLGNIAMKLGRRLHWDPVRERFVNDPMADRMLSRAMRGPWRLPLV